ncbi:MAG: ECF-type sigma factor [Planctomycetota bacterium]
MSPLEKWIVDSREGDEAALNQLAGYLLPKAFEFASRKMQNISAMDDYEDVAISAVRSICMRFRRGQSEFLGERELGALLRRFVIGKIRDRRKYHSAEKRNVNFNAGDETGNVRRDQPIGLPARDHAVDDDHSIWLDEHSVNLPLPEQEYLAQVLNGLGSDVQGLFSELVKRLDENPRKVLMLITTGSLSNKELAEQLECAPSSIERYRQAIRRKLEEIVNE